MKIQTLFPGEPMECSVVTAAGIITSQHVLDDLAGIALADITEVVQIRAGKVTVADTASLTREQLAMISSLEVDAGGRITLRFHDKVRALELIGRHLGLFAGDQNEKGDV